MNWTGTKWILIVVFMVLNLFLGYQLWQKSGAHLEVAHGYENTIDELLYLHHITLETELSLDQPALAQLEVSPVAEHEVLEGISSIYQEISMEDNIIHARLTPPLLVEGEIGAQHLRDALFKEYIFAGEEYRIHRDDGETFTYLQYYQDLPLFIASLQIAFNPSLQAVTGYEQIYLRILQEGEAQPIISSYTGLRTLIDQQIVAPFSTIHDVELGYHGHAYTADNQVLTPTWRFTIEEQGELKVSYVNAYTGAIELDAHQTDEVTQDEFTLLRFSQRQYGERPIYRNGKDAFSS